MWLPKIVQLAMPAIQVTDIYFQVKLSRLSKHGAVSKQQTSVKELHRIGAGGKVFEENHLATFRTFVDRVFAVSSLEINRCFEIAFLWVVNVAICARKM
ncbi:hypothetical protein CEXT_31 [Caerostris extrusa]|uniref:Uncharacterized protein n=1 Tax=Caerostris extrusa TaxID=172846 RepID=A0AAV4WM15_CAEEX|nr:hypothetical protein CEXT_31 [Caerostris extrusa]